MKTIGHKIKELRKVKGISQEELSLALDVSRQTIHKWESNAMRPGADNLKSLSDYFKVGYDYFLTDDESTAETVPASAPAPAASDGRGENLKNNLLVCFVITLISICLIISVVFTAWAGVIKFSDNVAGTTTVTTFYVEGTTFYLFLALSVILLALDVVTAVYIVTIKKRIKNI